MATGAANCSESHAALPKLALKGTPLAGLLETAKVCVTGGPPCRPLKNTVKGLTLRVFWPSATGLEPNKHSTAGMRI